MHQEELADITGLFVEHKQQSIEEIKQPIEEVTNNKLNVDIIDKLFEDTKA